MLLQHSAPATPPTAALVGDMFPVAAAQELAAARAAARRHGCPTRAALHALALHSGDAKLAGAWLQRRQYVMRQAVPLACLSGRVSVSTPQGLVVRLFTLKLHGTWAAVRGVLEWQQHQPRDHQQQQQQQRWAAAAAAQEEVLGAFDGINTLHLACVPLAGGKVASIVPGRWCLGRTMQVQVDALWEAAPSVDVFEWKLPQVPEQRERAPAPPPPPPEPSSMAAAAAAAPGPDEALEQGGATTIQRVYRGHVGRRQAVARMLEGAQRDSAAATDAAVHIASVFRGSHARHGFVALRRAAIRVQAWYRSHRARAMVSRRRAVAAALLVAWVRRLVLRRVGVLASGSGSGGGGRGQRSQGWLPDDAGCEYILRLFWATAPGNRASRGWGLRTPRMLRRLRRLGSRNLVGSRAYNSRT